MRDPATFDAFYSGSVRRVTGQLYAMTGSRAEAEDCVQEAYARAWQRWDKVSGYCDPEAWVRTSPTGSASAPGGRRRTCGPRTAATACPMTRAH